MYMPFSDAIDGTQNNIWHIDATRIVHKYWDSKNNPFVLLFLDVSNGKGTAFRCPWVSLIEKNRNNFAPNGKLIWKLFLLGVPDLLLLGLTQNRKKIIKK